MRKFVCAATLLAYAMAQGNLRGLQDGGVVFVEEVVVSEPAPAEEVDTMEGEEEPVEEVDPVSEEEPA